MGSREGCLFVLPFLRRNARMRQFSIAVKSQNEFQNVAISYTYAFPQYNTSRMHSCLFKQHHIPIPEAGYTILSTQLRQRNRTH